MPAPPTEKIKPNKPRVSSDEPKIIMTRTETDEPKIPDELVETEEPSLVKDAMETLLPRERDENKSRRNTGTPGMIAASEPRKKGATRDNCTTMIAQP